MLVKSLHIYPVKGAAAVNLTESDVQPHGLAHDRCWVPVDTDGRALLQWAHPHLAQVRVRLTPQGIALSAPQMPDIAVMTPDKGAPLTLLKIKKRELQAYETSAAAHEWFSAFLGASCKLLYKEDAQSGGTPVHFTTTASLEALNRRTQKDTPMDRFRPNIVIETATPWEEDRWQRIRIDSVELDVTKPCARCEVITTDQDTGERIDTTPLDTLKEFRMLRQEKPGIAFGLNASPQKLGLIRIGDTVEVLTTQEAPTFVVA